MTEKDKVKIIKILERDSRMNKFLMNSYKKGGEFYNQARREYIESERLIHRIKLEGGK